MRRLLNTSTYGQPQSWQPKMVESAKWLPGRPAVNKGIGGAPASTVRMPEGFHGSAHSSDLTGIRQEVCVCVCWGGIWPTLCTLGASSARADIIVAFHCVNLLLRPGRNLASPATRPAATYTPCPPAAALKQCRSAALREARV